MDQEKRLTSAEKLDAAKKVLVLLDREVPENDQMAVLAIAIKAFRGNFVVKYEGEVI